METNKPKIKKAILKKFKSYYVVWKHEGMRQVEATQKKFKSYYVVWKQASVKLHSIHPARV